MGSIGDELTQLAHRRVDAAEQIVERFGELAQLVVRRISRKRLPEPLWMGYAFGHGSGMLGEGSDGGKRSTHVKGRNSGRDQDTEGEQKQDNFCKTVHHSMGAKRGNSNDQKTRLTTLLERDYCRAEGLPTANIDQLECGMKVAGINLFQGNRLTEIS